MTDAAPDPPEPAAPCPKWFRRRGPRVAVAMAVLAVAFVAALQVRSTPPPTALQRTSGERAPDIQLPVLVDPDRTVDLEDLATAGP